MSQATTLDLVRFAWLMLATMMLLSRVIFQLGGAARMRAFLDTWKTSRTKRAWGALSLAGGLTVGLLAVFTFEDPSTGDLVVTVVLVVVLAADGMVNALPAGFETFKDRVQARWAGATGDRGLAADAYLFTVGNALLALAAGGAAAAVALYRPLDGGVLLAAIGVGAILTGVLILAARAEARRAGELSRSAR